MHEISRELSFDTKPDLVDVMRSISSRFDGAYSLVFLNACGDMMVARDPLGIKPLCYAKEGPLFAAASESVALLNLGFQPESIRSLPPGQMISIVDGVFKIETFAASPRRAHCFFEWVYFANVASTLDERSVYLSRTALGVELAQLEKEDGRIPLDDGQTIVVPVPDTSKAAADAMAFELGVPVPGRSDPQPVLGPHVHRRGRGPQEEGGDEIHAAAGSAGGQTRVPGGGLDRSLDHHEGTVASYSRSGRSSRDPRAGRLSPDHRPVLLRHRHVAHRRSCSRRGSSTEGR